MAIRNFFFIECVILLSKMTAEIAYYFIIILRIIFAPLIFFWPLSSTIISFFLDVIDIEFASRNVLTEDEYERYDKALDLWWYLSAAIYSWFYLKPYNLLLLILFCYRLIGDLIFFIKGRREIFLFFPNFFENIFFLLFFSMNIKQLNFLISAKYFYFSLIFVALIKIFQEWWIHWALISIPEKFFGKKRNWRKK